MATAPYIDGTGQIRQRALTATSDGSTLNPDVAIFQIDGSIARPTITYVTGTIAISGDNTIVAAPTGGNSIYITHLVLQNESATATTIILKDSSNRLRCLGQTQGAGLALTFPERRELKLAANTALILNLSGANSCGYSIGYYTGA